MTTNNPDFAPSEYHQHYSAEEFRFRWLEALSEVRDEWRHRGIDHLARALCDHMNVMGSCHPSLPRLSKIMVISEGTVRKNYQRLVEEGWLIVVPRWMETNLYQAVLPTYGLQLLMQKKEVASNRNSVSEWRDAADRVLSAMCIGLGVERGEVESAREWARIEGKVFRLLERLGGPQADVSYVIKRVIEEPPRVITSPVGLLMARITKAERSHPNRQGRNKKRSSTEHSAALEKIHTSTTKSLTSWKQIEGPATNDRSLERVGSDEEECFTQPHG
ncbi:MAG: helix-turn-helix domain-containing protein [Actinomycetota bacterium]